MPVYMGNTEIKDLYMGNTKIKEAYMGRVKIYPGGITPYTGKEFNVEYYESIGTEIKSLYIPADAKDLTIRIIGASAGGGYTNSTPIAETFYGEGSASGGFCECYYDTAFSDSTIYFKIGKGGNKGTGTSVIGNLSITSVKGENTVVYGDDSSIPIQIAEGSQSVYDSYNAVNEPSSKTLTLSNKSTTPTGVGAGTINKTANGINGEVGAYNKNTISPKIGLGGSSTVLEKYGEDYASKCIRVGNGGKGADDNSDGSVGYIFIGYNYEPSHRRTTFPFEYNKFIDDISQTSFLISQDYIKDLTVHLIGGGGGAGQMTKTGDDSTITIGGGGGSGYYATQTFSNITTGGTVYFQVGQGGNIENNGTASIFKGKGSSALLTANGGNAGHSTTAGTGANNGTAGLKLYSNKGSIGFGGKSADNFMYPNYPQFSIYGKGGNGFSIGNKGKGTNGYVFIGYNSDTQPEPPYTEPYNFIMINNSVYYASVDGINWKTYTSPVGSLTGISFVTSKFVITGANGYAISSNGKDWTTYSYPTAGKYSSTYNFTQVVYTKNKSGFYVASRALNSSGNEYTEYVTSTDLINWTYYKDARKDYTNPTAQTTTLYGFGTKVGESGEASDKEIYYLVEGLGTQDSIGTAKTCRLYPYDVSYMVTESEYGIGTWSGELTSYLLDSYKNRYLKCSKYGSSSDWFLNVAPKGYQNRPVDQYIIKDKDYSFRLCYKSSPEDFYLVYSNDTTYKNTTVYYNTTYASGDWDSYHLNYILGQVVESPNRNFVSSEGYYSTDGINWTQNPYKYKSNLTTRVSIASRN